MEKIYKVKFMRYESYSNSIVCDADYEKDIRGQDINYGEDEMRCNGIRIIR